MKLKNNVFDWIMDGLSIGICIFSAIVLAVRWNRIPKRIPSNYKMDGTIAAYSGKGTLIFLMVIIVIATVILNILMRAPQLWNLPCKVTDRNRYIVYRTTKYWLSIIRLVLLGSLSMLVITASFVKPLPSWYTWVELGAVFIIIVVGISVTVVKAKQYQ